MVDDPFEGRGITITMSVVPLMAASFRLLEVAAGPASISVLHFSAAESSLDCRESGDDAGRRRAVGTDSRPALVDQHRAVRTAREFFKTVTVVSPIFFH